MIERRLHRTLAFPALLILPSLAAAQTTGSATGAINGKVTDTTSVGLSGARVRIASASMMGARTAVTAEDGSYRFAAVPPGEYRITFERAGFSTLVREGIRVTLGFTATVNGELGVAAVSENVTVIGSSPVVDTSSTTITTAFDARWLAALPSARDLWAILAETPAVSMTRIDVGGSAAGTQTGYTAYGTSGQNRPTVEGIVATEGTDAAGFYYDYGSFADVNVGTAAHNAEMPWPGVQAVFVAKSGGNTYHGGWYSDYENERWQSFNVDEGQVARGAQGSPAGVTPVLGPGDLNRMTRYHDIDTDLGGFIRRDRAWWYGSFRNQHVAARYANFPVTPHVTDLWHYSGKATYRLSTNDKVVLFATANRKHQPTRLDSFQLGNTTDINLSAVSTWEQAYHAWVWKGEWSSTITDKTFLELRAGQFGYDWPNHANGGQPRYEDRGNNVVTGSNREWERDRRRNQVLGSVSRSVDGRTGSHTFKFGGELFREVVNEYWRDGYVGDVVHLLNNGNPIEVYLIDAPSASLNGLWTYSAYANDVWRIEPRLTLNLGVRLDRYRAFLPAQEHGASRWTRTKRTFAAVDDVVHFNLPAPRAGATYDISGDGKAVVKFNYGQYWWNPGADFLLTNVNPNAAVWWKRYTWTDPDDNGIYDPGEEGTLIQTSGGPAESLDPDLEDTFTRETAVWFERELMRSVAVRTGFLWRGQRQRYQRVNVNQPFSAFTVPVMIPDPGPDGRTGTSDDGAAIPGYDLDEAHRRLPPLNVTRNVPYSGDDYYTWEMTATKRFTNRWSLLASYAWTRSFDNNSTYFGQRVRSNNLVLTPNDMIHTDDGRYRFSTSTMKISGTCEAPYHVRVTPVLRVQSGQPIGRVFVAALSYGATSVLAEPLGTRRQDTIAIVDLRAEKVFGVRAWLQVSAIGDVFNLFNSNAEQNTSYNSGSSFLRPLTIVPPRIARLGARVTF